MNGFWQDHHGEMRPAPRIKGRLKFSKIPLHASLRAYVFRRDGFVCLKCGTYPRFVPLDFDGKHTLSCHPGLCLVMDHIISIRNGGTHHPDNLQTYCDSCNARKVGLVDRFGRPDNG